MKTTLLYLTIVLTLFFGCKERFSPKPTGYLRIDLNEKIDTLFNPNNCPFYFNTANYFKLKEKNNCWIDLTCPEHNATIHFTYKSINGNLFELLEDSRNMVYKHTIKADAINEKRYMNYANNTYGTLYDIKGEAASSVQFHITDSLHNFIRGALYFNVTPNQDSLRPIVHYLREDIIRMMETLKWVNLNASK
tara:strand:- start:737 stop:1312 length:576 start_codon:yes stop_codon:yes gene_type:complete